MIRVIAFLFALSFGVSASPLSQNVQKEISPTLDIVYAAEPIMLVTVAPVSQPKVQAKVKVKKKKPALTAKQKKKFAAASLTKQKQKDKKTDHHKSKVPDHHKSQSQNPSSHGPLHLTSPPLYG